MEPDHNPFASPAALVDEGDSSPVLEFRATRVAFLIAVPSMVACIGVVCVGIVMAVSGLTGSIASFRDSTIALLVAASGGVGAYGCTTVFWCKTLITEQTIERHDFNRHTIRYSDIESWHHQPWTKTIMLSVKSKRDFLPLNNWAMSRRRSIAVGKLLNQRFGPPKKR